MVASLRKAGFTDADIRHCRELAQQLGRDEVLALLPEIIKHKDRAERAVVRAALRRRAAAQP